jgi:phosphoesterase RecJ-like protein
VTVATAVDAVVEALRQADRLLLTTHENPDGDALGSLLGMHEILRGLGKDSLMFMPEPLDRIPPEYRHMRFTGAVDRPPDDVDERTIVFLDCGNIDRMPVDFLQRGGRCVLNIDHHHDNTRFGTVNLVVPEASCTAEIVFDLAKELEAPMTPVVAEALYVGLVTDTGRFMYLNTSPAAHRMAAELIEAGVEVHTVYRHLYESLPFGRLQLHARALGRAVHTPDGLVIAAHLTREDFAATGSDETDSEGIVDHLRAVEGARVAVLVRELLDDARAGVRKVSLRATDGRVDVSRIARAHGGGGHRQAAGFSTELEVDELLERVRAEVADQV